MRRLVPFAVVALVGLPAGCEPPADEPKPAEEARAPQPRPVACVAVEFVGFVEVEGKRVANFHFVNRADKPYRYSGYAADFPRTVIHRRTAAGEWDEVHRNWCGTKAAYYQLAPGGSMTLHVSVADDQRPLRLAVICPDAPGGERLPPLER